MEPDLESDSAAIDINGAQNYEPNLCENLEFWMSRLPSKLRTLPIIHLAIPGSHNTMTYTIERNNDVGPDEPVMIRILGRYFSPLAKPIIFNWCINQNESVKEQLNGGIRYLDLRVATKSSDDQIYFLHGLYGAEISQPLEEIAEWLSTHPNEVIVIDFQHFYDFDENRHRSLIDRIKYIFRGKMCPVHSKLENISLQWLSLERYQIFVIYRNIIASKYSDLWPSGLWITPWPNTVSTVNLVNFLNNGLKNRVQYAGFVSQCLLTPDIPYVIKHICGNLKRNLCTKCQQTTLSWIAEHSPGNGAMNIVISDYVCFDNFLFSKTVIQRNAVLLQSQSYYNSGLHVKVQPKQ